MKKVRNHSSSLEQEKDFFNKANDFASPIEQPRKENISEVEIPLDFEMDKSPPVGSGLGKFII